MPRPRKGIDPKVWQCVTCPASASLPIQKAGWLNYPGGRLCPGCLAKFARVPPGSYVELGHGWRFVKLKEG